MTNELMINDLIIIGGGPAGITAGIYASRKKISVLLIDKYFEVGGQLLKNSDISNYPGFITIEGYELSQKLKDHLIKNNVIIKEERVIKIENKTEIFSVFTGESIYKTKSIIVATGMQEKKSGGDNEEKFIGRGISYCATCDAPLYLDKTIGVFGEGMEAEKTIVEVLPYAKTIYFITDKTYDRFYLKEVKKNVQSGKVLIKQNSKIKAFKGKDNLEEVEIINEGRTEKIKTEGFFVSLGYTPSTDFIKDIVKLNSKNEIIIDLKNNTSTAGIFAAGDCTDYPYKQVITAAAQGAAAALSSYKYLFKL